MTVEIPDDADDQTLLAAIADKNQEAFHRFYRRHSSLVYALSRRITGQDQDAEDVVTEVFWELWEKSARYCPSKSSPHTYLIMLTRCRALDRKRGLANRRSHFLLDWLADEPQLDASAGEGPDEQFVTAESRELVTQALQELDANQRTAIELTFFDGLTHKATAERLGIPLGTVKGRVRTALAHLRGILRISQR